eukprot:jgi/Tetstr1/442304/TSEL_030445.t1
MADRRVRLWEARDVVRAGFSVFGMQQLWRESQDGSELHNYHIEAGELSAGTSRSARRRKRRRSARARAASAKAAEGGADAAADEMPPAVVDPHRRAAKLIAVQELRRARQALDTADLALHTDDPAAHEANTGEPLRVRPLGVGSALVRPVSAHALVHVGPDAQGAMGPDGAVYLGAPISHYPAWMTGALGRRREAHAALLERIASFGTWGYGCHHGAMRLLVVCAVRQTGFLNRMMRPSEPDPLSAAVDAANISAALSLLGLDACDHSTPRMEAAIVQMSMPADFGDLNMALLESEAPAAFYSAQSVVLPNKLIREYGPALGPLYEAVRAEVSSVATSALPWACETRRLYETERALTTLP